MLTTMKIFYKLAVRDMIFIIMLFFAWHWFAPVSANNTLMADFLGVLLGGLTALAFHLIHEWGHIFGGFIGGSEMSASLKKNAISLFTYPAGGNNRRQFLLMSLGGFIATALLVWFSYTQLADDQFASRIVRGYSLVQVFLAVVLEMPLVIWAIIAKDLPPLDGEIDWQIIKANIKAKFS